MTIKNNQTLLTILRILVISLFAGMTGACLVALFMATLEALIRNSSRLIPFAEFLTPMAGALLVGSIIIRRFPGAGGEGTNDYIYAVNHKGGRLSLADTLLKFPATILTLGFHGSGGIVGPLLRIGAGLSSFFAGSALDRTGLRDNNNLRTAAICGVSGVVSSIFHSPIGGGIFAAEILRRETMRYSDLFSSILTGAIAFITSAILLAQGPVFDIVAPETPMRLSHTLWLPLVGIAAGGIALLFIIIYERISSLMRRIPLKQPATALVGGAIVGLLWLMKADWALNISMPLFDGMVSGDLSSLPPSDFYTHNIAGFLLLALMVKIIATSFTVGSGMSGGFTGPLIILGVGSGALASRVIGFEAGSPEYFGFMACGLAATLASAANVPFAAIVITTRMFGGRGYLLPAITGAIIPFIIYKSRTIYEYTTTQWQLRNMETGRPCTGEETAVPADIDADNEELREIMSSDKPR